MDNLTPSFTGIDLGNKWCKRAFMDKNVSATYVNQGSRKSASTVAFIRNQRCIGSKSKKVQIKQPKLNLHKKFNLDTLANLNDEQNTSIQLDWGQSFCPFFETPFPLVAAYPIEWDFVQRLNLYKAAQLAGNKNLSLVRETTALAIHYYFHRLIRTNLDQPLKILFIDSGHSETKTAYVEYSDKEIAIKKHSVFPQISGLKLDQIICDYLIKKYDLNLSETLLSVAETLKKNISINQKVEYYSEQLEVNFTLNREEYLKITQSYWDNIPNLDLDVDAIEIIGGNIRSFNFIESLSKKFPHIPIQRSNDAEESVAHGCALWQRISQIKYRQVPIKVYDIVTELITIQQGTKIFNLAKPGEVLPMKKKLNNTLAKLKSPAKVFINGVDVGELQWDKIEETVKFQLDLSSLPNFENITFKWSKPTLFTNQELEQEQNFQVINQQIKRNQNSLNALEDYLFSHRETIPEKTQEIEDRLMNYQESISQDDKTYRGWLQEMKDKVKKKEEALEKEALEKEALEKEALEKEALEQEALEQELLGKEALEQIPVEQEPYDSSTII